MAFTSLKSDDSFELFSSLFTRGAMGIPINGLIWMGDEGFMKNQIKSLEGRFPVYQDENWCY